MKRTLSNIIKLISTLSLLIFSLLALFLPFALELFLGLSLIGTIGLAAGALFDFDKKHRLLAILYLVMALASLVLVALLLISGNLLLYYPIQIVNMAEIALYAVAEWIDINKRKARRRVIKNIGLGFLTAALAIIGAGGLLSHALYQRSVFSSLAEIFLKASNSGAFDSVEAARQYMEKRSELNDLPYLLPESSYQSKASVKTLHDHQAVYFENSDDPQGYVLYIHGGAYVNELSSSHVYFCDKLAYQSGYTVIAPIYPLAPKHTYRETYALIEDIYLDLLSTNKEIVIAGDSAGGGFAAAFNEYLNEKNIAKPNKAVLLSPWVDVSMAGTSYDDYYDPMLGVIGLKEMGKAWADDIEVSDYRISPLFGEVGNFPKTLMFVGTREIFYPDVNMFFDKLRENGVDVTLEIGQGMNHVYPVYPTLEARMAIDRIVSFILE